MLPVLDTVSSVCPQMVFSKHDITRTYMTHDNGCRKYKVKYSRNTVAVYANSVSFEMDYFDDFHVKSTHSTIVLSSSYTRILLGELSNTRREREDVVHVPGNSVLIEIVPCTYVLVSSIIIRFNTERPITDFHSPIYGADVSYPYADDGVLSYIFKSDGEIITIEDIFYDPSENPFFIHIDHVLHHQGQSCSCHFKDFNNDITILAGHL